MRIDYDRILNEAKAELDRTIDQKKAWYDEIVRSVTALRTLTSPTTPAESQPPTDRQRVLRAFSHGPVSRKNAYAVLSSDLTLGRFLSIVNSLKDEGMIRWVGKWRYAITDAGKRAISVTSDAAPTESGITQTLHVTPKGKRQSKRKAQSKIDAALAKITSLVFTAKELKAAYGKTFAGSTVKHAIRTGRIGVVRKGTSRWNPTTYRKKQS